MRLTLALAAPVLALAASAAADEGLWLPDAFPSARVEKAYGFAPSQAWLDHLRLASVRLARGCSGSFVSPHGLVQTNHHCARDCIAQLSTASEDLVETGFSAKTLVDERKCPDVEIDQLIAISDVTARMAAATAGRDGNARAGAERAAEAAIARECEGGDAAIRCDVVALYSGAIYQLYRYRRYLDVRLVFAPELAIATFGGDLDNYEFPRYVLDVTYPARLRRRPSARHVGEFPALCGARRAAGRAHLHVRQSGRDQPARHRRPARLRARRHLAAQPVLLFRAARSAHGVRRDQRRECADCRDAGARRRGLRQGRQGPVLCARRSRHHHRARRIRAGAACQGRRRSAPLRAVRAGLGRHPRRRSTASVPCATAMSSPKAATGFRSYLFRYAKTLVRHADEAGKPDASALREFTDASFPAQRQALHVGGGDLSRAREAHAVLFARAVARSARCRRSLGAQGARQTRAGGRRGRAHRHDEARGRRAAPPPDRRRRGDDRRERRSDDRVRAQDRPRSARRAPRL